MDLNPHSVTRSAAALACWSGPLLGQRPGLRRPRPRRRRAVDRPGRRAGHRRGPGPSAFLGRAPPPADPSADAAAGKSAEIPRAAMTARAGRRPSSRRS